MVAAIPFSIEGAGFIDLMKLGLIVTGTFAVVGFAVMLALSARRAKAL